ncbi:G-protein coupled receptor 54-like [Diadema antillarum]|uniref:G-protein coupled receptor 54-like n=1 Tax=Diadema antillarum TaxID=105358 RepID=UPI003A8580FA
MDVAELEGSVLTMEDSELSLLPGCGHFFFSDYSLPSSADYADCTLFISNILGNQTLPTRSAGYLIVPIVFGIITVVGLVGNFCVILIIARNQAMRSVTNYFIMNNAISDMMFLLACAPITASSFALPSWIFGDFMCKMVVYMQYVTVQASCATLVAMTADRYRVILRPIHSLHSRTVTRANAINVVIWIASFLLHIPAALLMEVHSDPWRNTKFCGVRGQRDSQKWLFAFRAYQVYAKLILYILPFVVMTYSYTRILRTVWSSFYLASMASEAQRKKRWKVTRMTLTVVVLFGVCWGPIHAINLATSFQINTEAFSNQHLTHFTFFSLCLAYSNSALNPFLYAFSGRSYREMLLHSFRSNKARRKSSCAFTRGTRLCSHQQSVVSAEHNGLDSRRTNIKPILSRKTFPTLKTNSL